MNHTTPQFSFSNYERAKQYLITNINTCIYIYIRLVWLEEHKGVNNLFQM